MGPFGVVEGEENPHWPRVIGARRPREHGWQWGGGGGTHRVTPEDSLSGHHDEGPRMGPFARVQEPPGRQ